MAFAHGGTIARHRGVWNDHLRLALRAGQPAPELELERRQPDRPRLDPFLHLLGRGRIAPVHEGALRAKAGEGHRRRPRSTTLLATVSLIAPAVLLVETGLGKPVDAQVIAVVAGVMFLLVLMRMAGLVQAHQQAVTHKVLRKAAAELVAAPGREGVPRRRSKPSGNWSRARARSSGVIFAVPSTDGLHSRRAIQGRRKTVC